MEVERELDTEERVQKELDTRASAMVESTSAVRAERNAFQDCTRKLMDARRV